MTNIPTRSMLWGLESNDISFRLRFHPGPRWGSLWRFPDNVVGWGTPQTTKCYSAYRDAYYVGAISHEQNVRPSVRPSIRPSFKRVNCNRYFTGRKWIFVCDIFDGLHTKPVFQCSIQSLVFSMATLRHYGETAKFATCTSTAANTDGLTYLRASLLADSHAGNASLYSNTPAGLFCLLVCPSVHRDSQKLPPPAMYCI